MGEAGSQKFVSEMRRLLRHETDCWSRRIGHTILVGLFLTSCHGAFAQEFGDLPLPSWNPSDNPAEYELGRGLLPVAEEPPNVAKNITKGSGPSSDLSADSGGGYTSGTQSQEPSGLFASIADPLGRLTDGFQPGSDSAISDSIEAVDEVPSSFSDVSNIPFSSSGLGSNGNPGGVPGLGRGPFSALGNALQGGNGNLMNTVLQGLAFFSMLQDLLAGFLNGDGQFNAANTGQSAQMAFANLMTSSTGGGEGLPGEILGNLGDALGGSPSGPLNHSLARDFITNTIGSRGSSGECASFGRRLVGALTGSSYFNQGLSITGTPYASMGGQYLLDSGLYSKLPVDPGAYQDGDTRIYQGGSGGKGHWETYYQGAWYSDHRQSSAYTHNIGNYYSGATVYRLR